MIHGRIVPPPNEHGWSQPGGMLFFDCSDDVQLARCDPDRRQIFEQVRELKVTGTATDAAGNTATATVVLHVDGTSPELSIDPIAGKEDWVTVAATQLAIRGRAADALSGVQEVRCTSIQKNTTVMASYADPVFTCTVPLLSTDSATTQILIEAKDRAGNTRMRIVTVSSDVSSPQIYVELPRERERLTRKPSVRLVAWLQDRSEIAKVLLNGKPLPFTPAVGKIDTTVDLIPGKNEIAIEAADTVGNKHVERLIVERLAPGDPRLPESVVDVIPDAFPAGDGQYRVRAILSPPRCGYFHDWRIVDSQGRPSTAAAFTSTPACRNQSECWAKFRATDMSDVHIQVSFAFEESEGCKDE